MKPLALSLASLWALLCLCSCCSLVLASSSTSDTEEFEMVDPSRDWYKTSFYARPLGSHVPFLLLTENFEKSFIRDPKHSIMDHFRRVNDIELVFLNGRAAPSPDLVLKKMVKNGALVEMVAPLNMETFILNDVIGNLDSRHELAGAVVTITATRFTCQMLSVPSPLEIVDVTSVDSNLENVEALLDEIETLINDPVAQDQPADESLIPFGQNYLVENKFGFLAPNISGSKRDIKVRCVEQLTVLLMFPGLFHGRSHVKVIDNGTGEEVERGKMASYLDLKHPNKQHHVLKDLYSSILDGSLQETVRLQISAIFLDGFFLGSNRDCGIGIQFERRLNHVEAAVLHEFLFGRIGYFSKMDECHCNFGGCIGCCSIPGLKSLTIDFQKRNFFLRHAKPASCKGLENTMLDLPMHIGDEARHGKIKDAVKTHRRRNNKIKAMMLGPMYPMQTNPVIISTTCPAAKAHLLIAEIGSKLIFDPADPVALRDAVDSVFYTQTSDTVAFVGITLKARSLIGLQSIRDVLNKITWTCKPSKPFELNPCVIVNVEEHGWIRISNTVKAATAPEPKKLTNKDIKGLARSADSNDKTSTSSAKLPANDKPKIISAEALISKFAVNELIDREQVFSKVVSTSESPEDHAAQTIMKFPDDKQVSLYIQSPGISGPTFLTNDCNEALFGEASCLIIPERILNGTALPGHVITLIQTPDIAATSLETYDLEQSECKVIGEDYIEYEEKAIVSILKEYIELVSENFFARIIFTPPRVIVQRCKMVRTVMSSAEPGYLAALPAENPDLGLRLPRISSSIEFCTVVPWLRTSVIWYNMSLADEGKDYGSPLVFRFFSQKAEFNSDALMVLMLSGDSLKRFILSIRSYYSNVVPGSLTVEISGVPAFLAGNPSTLRKMLPRIGEKQTHMITIGLPFPAGSKRGKANDSREVAILSDDFPVFTVENLSASAIKPSPIKIVLDLKKAFNQSKGKGSKGILIQRQVLPKRAEKHKSKIYTINLDERQLNQRLLLVATSLLNLGSTDDVVPMWIFALQSIQISPMSPSGKVKKSPMWKVKVEFFEDRVNQLNFGDVTKELVLLWNEGKSCRQTETPSLETPVTAVLEVKPELSASKLTAATVVDLAVVEVPLPIEEIPLPGYLAEDSPVVEPVEELLTIEFIPEFALPEEAIDDIQPDAHLGYAAIADLINKELVEEINAINAQLSFGEIVKEIAEGLFEETAYFSVGSGPMMPVESYPSFMTLMETLGWDNKENLKMCISSAAIESLVPKAGSGRQTLKKNVSPELVLPAYMSLVKMLFMDPELRAFVLAIECTYESGKATLSLTCDIPQNHHFSVNMYKINIASCN